MNTYTILQLINMHNAQRRGCRFRDCPLCRWWTPRGGEMLHTVMWNKLRVANWIRNNFGFTVKIDMNQLKYWCIDAEEYDLQQALQGRKR